MKKLSSLLFLLLITFTITACHQSKQEEPTVCQHRDSDDNSLCDTCGEAYTDGLDTEIYICRHRDANDDGKCDECRRAYTDGTDVTHLHSFGNWILYGDATNTPCQDRLFYRTCPSCGDIDWKNGGYGSHTFQTVTVAPTCTAKGYDEKTCSTCGLVEKVNLKPAKHNYKTTYTINESFHWLGCKDCDATKSYDEHTTDDAGICTVCDQPILPTDGIVYALSANGTYAEVIGYTGTATRILIADTYQGVPVKTIYNEAFTNTAITAVIIPDSVTKIGDYAFYSCDRLASITIPDSVTYIGDDAFLGCSSLTSISISNNVTSIGYNAFSGCNSALYTEYEYGKYIGDAENPYQVMIDVTNNNQSTYKIHMNTKIIAGSAFSGCNRLSSIIIPDSVTAISDWAFGYCDSLASVTIGNSVTSIGFAAFFLGHNLTSAYYKGTEEDWYTIFIDTYQNSSLTDATRYYYSETAPSVEGNYWHYDAEGKIAIWE